MVLPYLLTMNYLYAEKLHYQTPVRLQSALLARLLRATYVVDESIRISEGVVTSKYHI